IIARPLGLHGVADPLPQAGRSRATHHALERSAHRPKKLGLFPARLASRDMLVDFDELRRFELAVEVRAEHSRAIAAFVHRHAVPRLRARYSSRFAAFAPSPPTRSSPFTMPSASAWL